VTAVGVLAFGFPNPFDLMGDIRDALVGAPAAMAQDMFANAVAWLIEAVLGALAELSASVLGFFWDAAEPEVGASWFSGSDDTPYGQMVVMTVPLLLAFFLVGVIQGVLKGDPAGMARMAMLRLPGAVLAMAVTVAITDVLVKVTDEMSRTVLGGSRSDIESVTQMFAALATIEGLSGAAQLLVIVFGIIGLLAAVVLVIELFVRAGLIYIVVALSPLIYAASVWESLRGAVRKMAEIGLAIILSKLVIAVALSLSAAAMAAAGGSSGDSTAVTTPEQAADLANGGGDIAQTVGVVIGAIVMFGIAAFMPFVLFKLLPIAEGALVSQGIKGAPARAGMQASQGTAMARSNPASRALRSGSAGGGSRSGSSGLGMGPAGGGGGTAAGAGAGAGGAGAGGAGAGAAAGPAGAALAATASTAKKVASDATRNMTSAADAGKGTGAGDTPAPPSGARPVANRPEPAAPVGATSRATTNRPSGGPAR